MMEKQHNKFYSITFTSLVLRVYPGLLCTASFVMIFILSAVSYAETVRGTVNLKSEEDTGKVVVYIEKADGVFIPPEKHPIMDQIDLTFVPFVLPVLIGTTVDFHNSDDVLNNIFTPSWAGHKFNLGTYPKSVVRSFTFDRLGVVALLCNIHPDMEGYILVLQNTYFTIPDKEGRYQIKDIPPGIYDLRMWYKAKISPAQTITVEKGKETVVDFR